MFRSRRYRPLWLAVPLAFACVVSPLDALHASGKSRLSDQAKRTLHRSDDVAAKALKTSKPSSAGQHSFGNFSRRFDGARVGSDIDMRATDRFNEHSFNSHRLRDAHRQTKTVQDRMVLDAAQSGRGMEIQVPSDPRFRGMKKMSYSEKSREGVLSEVHYIETSNGNRMDFKVKHASLQTQNAPRQ